MKGLLLEGEWNMNGSTSFSHCLSHFAFIVLGVKTFHAVKALGEGKKTGKVLSCKDLDE